MAPVRWRKRKLPQNASGAPTLRETRRLRRWLRGPDCGLVRQEIWVEALDQLTRRGSLSVFGEAERTAHPAEDFPWALPQRGAVGERYRAVALRQAPPVGTQHERHVSVAGSVETEVAREQNLAWSRIGQVGAPYDLAYLLSRVVHDHRKLVGGCSVVTANDEVVYLFLIVAEQPVFEGDPQSSRPHPQGGRADARVVQVLHPHQETRPSRAREEPGQQRCTQVSKVERPRGTRGIAAVGAAAILFSFSLWAFRSSQSELKSTVCEGSIGFAVEQP